MGGKKVDVDGLLLFVLLLVFLSIAALVDDGEEEEWGRLGCCCNGFALALFN